VGSRKSGCLFEDLGTIEATEGSALLDDLVESGTIL
jgi:hypothetical protein